MSDTTDEAVTSRSTNVPPKPPLRAVVSAAEVENTRRRAGSRCAVPLPTNGWHWRLTLACGHRTRRPCRHRRTVAGTIENVPAPRRVRCDVCVAVEREKSVNRE